MKAIYTAIESTHDGEAWFFVYDQNKNLKADCATKSEAEEIAAFYTAQQEEIAQNFDYHAGMYGSDSEYSQGKGNSEADEDRSFGL